MSRPLQLCALLALLVSGAAAAEERMRLLLTFGTAPSVAAEVAAAMRARLDRLGAEAEIAPPGPDGRIRVTLDGPAEAEDAVVAALLAEGRLAFHSLPDFADGTGAACPDPLPHGLICLTDLSAPPQPWLFDATPALTPKEIGAEASIDGAGRPAVSVILGTADAERFCALTLQHVGERLAVVHGDRVLTVPLVQEPICGGRILISGSFGAAEAAALAEAIGMAPYAAPVAYLESVRTEAPESAWGGVIEGLKTLGQD
ncbi:hypothetical protein LNKW23_20950 [Paralimibaculum aggregatum]|uniref:SecDF P1 head subdomain domain-containing protein n=1 Tax=Paralimibaculum aggregatum TaxID=3036245 RepID=A0ABQ6LMG0_9RHOB|nr:hypothetical protein [Limibaculum sp. NKW23]GMG82882.1 hypothetical protein LNKW23_20950 [Limibaculum sp. NKW23]